MDLSLRYRRETFGALTRRIVGFAHAEQYDGLADVDSRWLGSVLANDADGLDQWCQDATRLGTRIMFKPADLTVNRALCLSDLTKLVLAKPDKYLSIIPLGTDGLSQMWDKTHIMSVTAAGMQYMGQVTFQQLCDALTSQ